MKHIAQFNEENKWRNIALGAMLLFTSCKDEIHIKNKEGNQVSVDNFKGKTIEVVIKDETIVGLDPLKTETTPNGVSTSIRTDMNQNYLHDITVVDTSGK